MYRRISRARSAGKDSVSLALSSSDRVRTAATVKVSDAAGVVSSRGRASCQPSWLREAAAESVWPALYFAHQGWDVYASVRNPGPAPELQQTIAAERLPIILVTIDVDDPGSVTRGVGEVLARAGRIDALVNNAGIGGGGAIEDAPAPSST